MAVVDIIMKIDSEGYLKEVSCIGKCKEWFREYDWNGFREEGVLITDSFFAQ